MEELPRTKLGSLKIEEVAARHGGIILFLPNAGPHFNAIEKLWRLIKSDFSKLPQAEPPLRPLLPPKVA